MADASQVFNFPVPPGNGSSALSSMSMNLGLSEVTGFSVRFPAGCCGLVGVAIYAAHSPAFPVGANQYWAFDDYIYVSTVTNQIQTGQWGLVCYNLDAFTHTIQCVMEYDYVITDALANASLQVSI
jgi:hypothetical protein